MNMGDRIRELRISKGITQEELGRVIGVHRSAVRKYESGQVQNIKRSSIKLLADYFGVSPTYLLGFEDGQVDAATEIEAELINLSRKMTVAQKVELLNAAYSILKRDK